MSRTRRGAAAGVLLALTVGVPTALAQSYEPAPTTTTTSSTSTSSTTSTTEATTTTQAPEPATEPAAISDATVEPGQPVTIGSQPGAVDTFDPDSRVEVAFARGVQGTEAVPLATATVNDDGTVSVDVVIPEGTATGVYYMYIVGTAPDGATRVLVAPIVVTGADGGATGAGGTSTVSGGAATVEVPAEVASLQAINSLPTADEAAIVTDVTAGRAQLGVEGNRLVVGQLPITGSSDGTRPLVAAAAVAIAGGALLVRRSRTSIARRS